MTEHMGYIQKPILQSLWAREASEQSPITPSLLAGTFQICHLLIAFVNSLDPDQGRQNRMSVLMLIQTV